jgi:hypothetical protein
MRWLLTVGEYPSLQHNGSPSPCHRNLRLEKEFGMARRTAISSRLAATLAAAFVLATSGVSHAADGTIHFTGRIVEPPYELRIAPTAAPSAFSASMAGAEIIFSGSGQSANVSVESLGKLQLAVQCSGRAAVPVVGCHFDRRGGTLAVAMKSTRPAGVTPGAVVTVAYD